MVLVNTLGFAQNDEKDQFMMKKIQQNGGVQTKERN